MSSPEFRSFIQLCQHHSFSLHLKNSCLKYIKKSLYLQDSFIILESFNRDSILNSKILRKRRLVTTYPLRRMSCYAHPMKELVPRGTDGCIRIIIIIPSFFFNHIPSLSLAGYILLSVTREGRVKNENGIQLVTTRLYPSRLSAGCETSSSRWRDKGNL